MAFFVCSLVFLYLSLRAIIYKKKKPIFYFLLQKSTFNFFFLDFFTAVKIFKPSIIEPNFLQFFYKGSFWQSGFFYIFL